MKKIIAGILLFCYLIPFVFLAMNEDATTGTLWFHLIMIIAFLIQIAFVIHYARKSNGGIENEKENI